MPVFFFCASRVRGVSKQPGYRGLTEVFFCSSSCFCVKLLCQSYESEGQRAPSARAAGCRCLTACLCKGLVCSAYLLSCSVPPAALASFSCDCLA